MGILDAILGGVLGGNAGGPMSGQLDNAAGGALDRTSTQAQNPLLLMALQLLQQNGGLQGILAKLQQAGYGQQAQSWIGTGPNHAISPNQLRQAIGQDAVDDLAQQTGLPHDDLLSQLSKILPGVVDKLTPNGQLPNETDLLPGPR